MGHRETSDCNSSLSDSARSDAQLEPISLRRLYDTHCHLDASEFDSDRLAVIDHAWSQGVRGILIPAVDVGGFERVRDLAHLIPWAAYAIGIHPMYVHAAARDDLARVHEFISQHIDDPKLVAVGEIGLDFFVPEIASGQARSDQIHFYREQMKIAREFELPVLLHVRKSQDELLKWLRRDTSPGGIVHAFNGSLQQARQFIEQGFVLGVGGAMTFARALQIRRLATDLPLSALVLETDAPDISPAWLARGERNEPSEVYRIASELARLRQCEMASLVEQTGQNALRVIPRLAAIWS